MNTTLIVRLAIRMQGKRKFASSALKIHTSSATALMWYGSNPQQPPM